MCSSTRVVTHSTSQQEVKSWWRGTKRERESDFLNFLSPPLAALAAAACFLLLLHSVKVLLHAYSNFFSLGFLRMIRVRSIKVCYCVTDNAEHKSTCNLQSVTAFESFFCRKQQRYLFKNGTVFIQAWSGPAHLVENELFGRKYQLWSTIFTDGNCNWCCGRLSSRLRTISAHIAQLIRENRSHAQQYGKYGQRTWGTELFAIDALVLFDVYFFIGPHILSFFPSHYISCFRIL